MKARGLAALPHRRAAALAVPAIASNAAVPLAGLVDTAVLGHFTSAVELGAVGLGAAVVASVFWAFSFLRPGTTALVGQAFGADNRDTAVRHLQRALALAALLGLAWVALQWVIVPALVTLLAQGAAAGPLAAEYSLIRGLSLPGVLVTLAAVGYFIGTQNTRTPLLIAATVAGLNVGLDFAFIAGFGWGSAGAAWATFAAEWTGAALAAALLLRGLGADGRATLRDWSDASVRTGWRSLMSMNGNLVARTALLMTAITVVASFGSRYGAEVLAANAILLQLMYLASYSLDGYATAAEAMAAREIGGRDVGAFHRANAATALAGAAIAAAMTLAFWLGRDLILAALTDLPGVTAVAADYWWAAVALPVVSGAAWMLDGIFLGTGRARDMVVSMAVSVVLVFAGVLAVGAALGALTNALLWAAFLAMNVARALTLGARYWHLTRTQGWLARG